jgi:Fe-S oxidoreductase
MPTNTIKEFSALRDFYSEISGNFLESCSLCGQCIDVCPVIPMTSCSEEDPADVQQTMLDALSGKGSDIAVEMASSCSGCDQCIESCPMELNPYFLREILKKELVKCGFRKAAKPLKINDRLIDLQVLLGSLQIHSSEKPWLLDMPSEPLQTDIVVFLGCSVRYQPDKGLALCKIIDTAGIDYIAIEGGELCCGGMYVRDGDIDRANTVAGRLIDSIDAFRPEKVVFSCSSCYKRVGEIMETLDNRTYEVQHASTFLSQNIERLNFTHRIEKTVTVHDPCDLRWKPEDMESVRRLIRKIPGVTLKEMPYNRETTLCCGIGSHDKAHKISGELRQRVLVEAQKTNAHVLATVCTGCHSHFCRTQKEYPFQIVHYASLLAAAMGFSFEDKIKQYLNFETIDEIMEDAAEFIETSPFTMEEFRQVLPLFFKAAKP